MQASILLVYTGGTIGMVQDQKTGLLKPFDVENILAQIPQLKSVKAKVEAVSTKLPKDSANMTPEDWQEIGQLIFDSYSQYSGFVVLHGTDTMAYTTSALSFMFQNLTKPIVFTGSQLPIGELRTDALENVLTAIEIALLTKDNRPVVNEVCLYFGNKLFRGNRVTKISSQNFNAFDSPNCPPLIVSNINLAVNNSLLKSTNKATTFNAAMADSVFVYKIHPSIAKKQFLQVCAAVEFKVLVLETYGSGTLFHKDWLVRALLELREKGVEIINVSQCVYGAVSELYEVSKELSDIGIISAKAMTLESVIAKSMHLLGSKTTEKKFRSLFITDLAGELS